MAAGGCCAGRVVAGLIALVLFACIAGVAFYRVSQRDREAALAAAAPTPTATPDIPALNAFPLGVTPAPGAAPPASAAAPPTTAGTSPNGNPTTPGWGLWTPTPAPPPPAATPPAAAPQAAPPPGATPGSSPPGAWYPPPGPIPWYGPWLINGKYVWWQGGWYPWPPPGHPGGGWPAPAPTRPPGALPFGMLPGYRCADGFYIERGQGDWQWPLGRYVVDGETITDRLGGPGNRPTVHTGCKPVP